MGSCYSGWQRGVCEEASFGRFAFSYITRCRMTKEEFCRRTLLSEKTFERIKYDALADRPKPETVMQVCVGLGLAFPEAEELFNAAGYHLGGCRLHGAYRWLLSAGGSLTIYECNDVLRSLGLPPLARWVEER